jgi:hypothetical protein
MWRGLRNGHGWPRIWKGEEGMWKRCGKDVDKWWITRERTWKTWGKRLGGNEGFIYLLYIS